MADHTYFVQEKFEESESLSEKQKLKTKSGQARAKNKNKHWSCLSQVEMYIGNIYITIFVSNKVPNRGPDIRHLCAIVLSLLWLAVFGVPGML